MVDGLNASGRFALPSIVHTRVDYNFKHGVRPISATIGLRCREFDHLQQRANSERPAPNAANWESVVYM